MSKNQSVNPHDAYFKLLMDAKENAAEIITASFPAKIVKKLNLATLKNMNTSYIDEQIRNFSADVVYECELQSGQRITITLLFEHKSYKVRHPHLQLLRYMVGIWETEEKNEPHLKPILPIVFYHGQDKWTYRRFEEYFLSPENAELKFDPDLAAYLPSFDYININLQERGNSWIARKFRRTGLRISLLLMRNIRSKTLHLRLKMIFEDLEELKKTEKGRREFKEILLYLSKGSGKPPEEIKDIMDHETFINLPNPVGSMGWQMEQQNIAKGVAEGLEKGIEKRKAEEKIELVWRLIKKGYDSESIADITDLSIKEIEKIRK
jgi:predicted transposase/invertase (TIGR01784 family)